MVIQVAAQTPDMVCMVKMAAQTPIHVQLPPQLQLTREILVMAQIIISVTTTTTAPVPVLIPAERPPMVTGSGTFLRHP